MTEGSPWKHILKFSLPVLLGSLMQQLYNTADTLIVGRVVGEETGSWWPSATERTMYEVEERIDPAVRIWSYKKRQN